MIDVKRLIRPDDEFRRGFPGLDFREVYDFHTAGEPVLVTDPTYLADVYNSKDEHASFLRASGVFVMHFGGDVSGPVWWEYPNVLIAISMHLREVLEPPPGVTELGEVGCDSGSFIFLPLTDDIPPELMTTIQQVIGEGNGVALNLPPGHWAVYYEQWEPREGLKPALCRNIVLRRES